MCSERAISTPDIPTEAGAKRRRSGGTLRYAASEQSPPLSSRPKPERSDGVVEGPCVCAASEQSPPLSSRPKPERSDGVVEGPRVSKTRRRDRSVVHPFVLELQTARGHPGKNSNLIFRALQTLRRIRERCSLAAQTQGPSTTPSLRSGFGRDDREKTLFTPFRAAAHGASVWVSIAPCRTTRCKGKNPRLC